MPKQISIIVGIVLIAFGGYILSGKFTTSRTEQVLNVGDLHASTQTRESLPPWAGYLAIGVGVVVLLTGVKRKD